MTPVTVGPRLIDIDAFARETGNGRTAIMRVLERYERAHRLDQITVASDGEWDVQLVRKGTQA